MRDRTRFKLETHRLASNRVATALDSVRRTGHQQPGRLEKSAGPAGTWRLVRQHKDDFVIGFVMVIAVSVVIFRDHDGGLRRPAPKEAPFREQRFGVPTLSIAVS